MNYVNIEGERINLNTVLGYGEDGKHLNFYIPAQVKSSETFQILTITFLSSAEAQQCINFLDKKTKCEAFILAN